MNNIPCYPDRILPIGIAMPMLNWQVNAADSVEASSRSIIELQLIPCCRCLRNLRSRSLQLSSKLPKQIGGRKRKGIMTVARSNRDLLLMKIAELKELPMITQAAMQPNVAPKAHRLPPSDVKPSLRVVVVPYPASKILVGAKKDLTTASLPFGEGKEVCQTINSSNLNLKISEQQCIQSREAAKKESVVAMEERSKKLKSQFREFRRQGVERKQKDFVKGLSVTEPIQVRPSQAKSFVAAVKPMFQRKPTTITTVLQVGTNCGSPLVADVGNICY